MRFVKDACIIIVVAVSIVWITLAFLDAVVSQAGF